VGTRRWCVVLAAVAACAHATPVAPPPAQLPFPPPPPVPDQVPVEPLTVCVVRDGVLRYVSVTYDDVTGDSLYQGRRFREAFPMDSSYAASARWYHDYETVNFLNHRYVIYGLPRALGPLDIEARGEYRGVTVFAEPTASRTVPEVVYLPVRPTCEFQPYETEMGGPVRGG